MILYIDIDRYMIKGVLNMAGKRRLQILSSKRAHHPLAF